MNRPLLIMLTALSALASMPAPAQAGPVEDAMQKVFDITDCWVFGPCELPCQGGCSLPCVDRPCPVPCTEGATCPVPCIRSNPCPPACPPDNDCVAYVNSFCPGDDCDKYAVDTVNYYYAYGWSWVVFALEQVPCANDNPCPPACPPNNDCVAYLNSFCPTDNCVGYVVGVVNGVDETVWYYYYYILAARDYYLDYVFDHAEPYRRDSDGDGYTDKTETAMCEHENPSLASDGSCVGTNWTAPGTGAPAQDASNFQRSLDADADNVPDDLEATLCARENPMLATDGSCVGPNWTAPGTGAPGQDAGNLLTGLDMDGDKVPDVLEPALCANEDPSLASDGSCVGTNWTAPGTGAPVQDAGNLVRSLDTDGDAAPDELEPVLCQQENPFFNYDGSCVGSDWTPPTAGGVVEDVFFLLES